MLLYVCNIYTRVAEMPILVILYAVDPDFSFWWTHPDWKKLFKLFQKSKKYFVFYLISRYIFDFLSFKFLKILLEPDALIHDFSWCRIRNHCKYCIYILGKWENFKLNLIKYRKFVWHMSMCDFHVWWAHYMDIVWL